MPLIDSLRYDVIYKTVTPSHPARARFDSTLLERDFGVLDSHTEIILLTVES